jgi:hypothetical protein
MLYKYKLDFTVIRNICRERVQTMKEKWSRQNYAWGKTDIVPSISSSCSSFDRESKHYTIYSLEAEKDILCI